VFSRVRETGHAGVRDESDRFSRRETPQQLLDPRLLARGRAGEAGPAEPNRAASLPVTRVSSQRIASASVSACRARGERSSRFPIGVPTTSNRPVFSEGGMDSENNTRLFPCFSRLPMIAP
jgi:hypothetical protein